MASFFDNFFSEEPPPESYEEDYIDDRIPTEARDLWDVTISHSPLWDEYSAEDHMFLADIFSEAVVTGDMYRAEQFLEYLEVEWDEYDVGNFYEAYELTKG